MSALTLVLIAAIVHATWNLIAKRVTGDPTAFVWLSSAIGCALYVPVVAIFVTVAHPHPLDARALALVAGTGLLHLGYFVLLQRGYRVGDLSLVYPLARGTGPLLSSIVAIAAFGERPSALGILGIACIVAGVFLAASGRSGERDPRRRRISVAYGVATGVSIAAYTLWDKYAVSTLALSPILYDFGRNVTQMVVLGPWALGRGRTPIGRTWADARGEALAVAVLSPVAYVLVLFALVRAPVTLVAPAREISIVFGTLLGARFFGEAFAGRRIAGAIVMFAGIVAIAHG